MASPLPTNDQLVPIPVAASLAGYTPASAAGFTASLPLAEQATTHSITCTMDAEQFPPWSDLPPELLDLVLKRLPSLADRVRLRAVCHPWRSKSVSSSHALPLPFPWLTLPDGTFLSIPGGEVHRMPVPDGACCHGSIDNSLFLMSSDGACSLLNPFSKTTLVLPNLAPVWQNEIDGHTARNGDPVSYKLVAPSTLESSPKYLAAALVIGSGYSEDLCIVQPPATTRSFRGTTTEYPSILVDLAFFNGRLYVASEYYRLFIVDFSEDLSSNPNLNCVIDSIGDFLGMPQYLNPKGCHELKQYLVESGGKLLMVMRYMRTEGFRSLQTVGFKVLEADMSTNPGQWRIVSDLGGHALFLGKQCSKSLPAGECGGSQEDCIYFICDYPCPESSANPLHDAGIYSMRSGTIMPLHSGTPAIPQRQAGRWGLTWFFPPAAVWSTQHS